MKFSISEKNHKLGRMLNWSLSTDTCTNAPCRGICYARRIEKRYKDTGMAWKNNAEMVKHHLGDVRDQLTYRLERYRGVYARIHVAGDFISKEYFEMVCEVARAFPRVHFLAYTRVAGLDVSLLPRNFTLTESMWPGEDEKYPMLHKSWLDVDERRNGFLCVHKCSECKHCWMDNGDTVFPLRLGGRPGRKR